MPELPHAKDPVQGPLVSLLVHAPEAFEEPGKLPHARVKPTATVRKTTGKRMMRFMSEVPKQRTYRHPLHRDGAAPRRHLRGRAEIESAARARRSPLGFSSTDRRSG